jgi:hypothetical protein
MENLPAIQATLDEWLQLTIAQPLYAAAIAIVVWLLTALLYSIRISGLNKKNIASENARTSAEANLNTAQQQRQQAQTELATLTEQLTQQQQSADAEKLRALASEQQNAQRNQQIAAIIQRLASSFDIGERPVQVIDNLKADDLWQQHDKVISKLIETLRTEQLAKTELEKFYQAEKVKVSETEARLSSLQANLDSQSNLVLTLQQQQNDTQRNLTDTLEKYHTTLARLLPLEQQAEKLANAQIQFDATRYMPIAPVETTPAYNDTVEQPVLDASVKLDEATTKLQNLFKKPEQPPLQIQEDNLITPPQETAQRVVTESSLTDNAKPTAEIIADISEKADSGSVLKGWYNKLTTKKSATPEIVPEPVVEPEPLTRIESVEEIAEKTSKPSALKGLYQKFTTAKPEQPEVVLEPPVTEPAPATNVEPVEENSNTSGLKDLYQKFSPIKPEQPEAAFEPPLAESITETAEKTSNIGQLKGLYQKYTAKKTHEKDLAPESFDNASSSLEDKADQITEKLEQMKNLYGKFFSKNK